jgi:hypothetical protein
MMIFGNLELGHKLAVMELGVPFAAPAALAGGNIMLQKPVARSLRMSAPRGGLRRAGQVRARPKSTA